MSLTSRCYASEFHQWQSVSVDWASDSAPVRSLPAVARLIDNQRAAASFRLRYETPDRLTGDACGGRTASQTDSIHSNFRARQMQTFHLPRDQPWVLVGGQDCGVCGACPVRCRTYGYLPRRTASPLIGRYQIILHGNRGTYVWTVNDSSRVAGRESGGRKSNLRPVDRKSSALTTPPQSTTISSTPVKTCFSQSFKKNLF